MAPRKPKTKFNPYAVSAARKLAEQESGGGDGLFGLGFGPDIGLGIGELATGIAGGITALARAAAPGSKAGEPGWADLGKGMATSATGTLSTVLKSNPFTGLLYTHVPGVEDFVEGLPTHLGAEAGQDIYQRIRSGQGLLPAIVEDIGNVAIAGGAVTAPLKIAKAGAKTVRATGTATKLGEAVTKLDATPVLSTMKHPYIKAGSKVREAVLKPAQRKVLQASGVEDAALGNIAQKAIAIDNAIADGPIAAADEAPDVLPQASADGSTAALVAEKLATSEPSFITRKLADVEYRIQAHQDARATARFETRVADMERRAIASSDAVKASVNIARDHLMDVSQARLGRRMGKQEASNIVGDETKARLEGTKALEDVVPEDLLVRPGARQNLVPKELRTSELTAALDEVADLWRAEKVRYLEKLAESRRGLEGIDAPDAMLPKMTPKQQKMVNKAAKLEERAASDVLMRKEMRERVGRATYIAGLQSKLGRTADVARKAEADILAHETAFGETRGLSEPRGNRTMRQEAGEKVNLGKSATPHDYTQGGRKMQEAIVKAEQSAKIKRQAELSRIEIEQSIADAQAVLDGDQLPSQIERNALNAEAAKLQQKVREQLAEPSNKNTPSRWQPLMNEIKELGALALKSPEMAEILKDVPKTLEQVQRLALEKGFDPVHVSDLSPAKVRRLAFGNMRLSLGGGNLLEEAKGGFRNERTLALRKAGGTMNSIESLQAALIEGTIEARQNHLITHVEEKLARKLPAGTEPPKGWRPWEPARNFILAGVELSDDGRRIVSKPAGDTTIVPDAVYKTLENFTKDFDHWSLQQISKVTNPWRMLVLTLSPGWYTRNFVGNVIMAMADGVRIQDWAKAWHSYHNERTPLGRFQDIPFVTTKAMQLDTGLGIEASSIPSARGIAGLRESVTENALAGEGKLLGTGRAAGWARAVPQEVARHAIRMNEVVDQFARSAVYHKNRRLNMTPEKAWDEANKAMVDYSALSPFERSAVRAVIPFYSWQKGIMKVLAKQAIDHPARIGFLMQAGKINDEYIADYLGVDPEDVPDMYKGLIGDINTRGYNPFSDSSALLSPEGIAQSMNPFLEVAIRKGLGAPEFYSKDYRLGAFGQAQQDLSVPTELLGLATNTPVGKLLGTSRTGEGGMESVPGLFGLAPVDITKIRSRLLKTRQQVRGIPNPETQANQLLPTHP